LAGWANGWTFTYGAACSLAVAGIWMDRRQTHAVRWLRLGAWLALAAVLGIVFWSVLGCLWLHLVEHPQMVILGWDPVACVLGSSWWAGFVVAALLPLYALLLTWYTQRYGAKEDGRKVIAARMLLLSLPGALWIAYAYAFPVIDLARSFRQGSAYGGIAFASCWLALTGPRLVSRRLGAGALWRRVAA
jgi:hypothetical protein